MGAESAPTGKPKAPEDIEPTAEKKRAYFVALGQQLKNYLRVLKAPEFKASAKPEGWFIGHHSIVETAFVLKIAEMAHLSEEDTLLLVQAAMLHDANKRNMYERDAAKTTSERFASRVKGEEELARMGIDRRVLIISRGVGGDFPARFVGAEEKTGLEKDPAVFRLEGFLSYIHNSIETTVEADATGKKNQKTEITSWQERLRLAKERHPEVAAETVKVGDHSLSPFDIEAQSTGAIENEFKRLIAENTGVAVDENTPLSAAVKSSIMDDIRTGKMPKIPSKHG